MPTDTVRNMSELNAQALTSRLAFDVHDVLSITRTGAHDLRVRVLAKSRSDNVRLTNADFA